MYYIYQQEKDTGEWRGEKKIQKENKGEKWRQEEYISRSIMCYAFLENVESVRLMKESFFL